MPARGRVLAQRRATARVAPTVLVLIVGVCIAAGPVSAQSVADYYHTAARHYIGEENAAAEAAAEAGLALDPTNDKLRALLEKIRERNPDDSGAQEQQDDADEQQPGEGEQQQNSNAENGDQEQSDAESEGERQDEQSRQPNQQQPGEQQPPEDEPSPDEREGNVGKEGDEPPDEPQGGGAAGAFDVQPGEMSRDEAERILRAIQTDELELLRDVQRRRARPRYVEKDW